MGKKSSQRNKTLAKAQVHQSLREYTQDQAMLWLVYQAATKARDLKPEAQQAKNSFGNQANQASHNLEYYLPIPQDQASNQTTYSPNQTFNPRYNFVSFFAIKAANQAAYSQIRA